MLESNSRNVIGAACVALSVFLWGCGGGGGGAADVTAEAGAVGGGSTGGSTGGTTSVGGSTPVNTPLMIDSTSPATYEWASLASGSAVYTDRTYTWQSVPSAYNGLQYLRTANDDKSLSGPSVVSFHVNQTVTVFVAFDPRFSALPAWLQSWTATGDVWVASHLTFDVYSKEFPAGLINLGGNEFGGSNYALAVSAEGGGIVGGALGISGNPPASITEGMAYSFSPTTTGGTGTLTFSIANKPAWASFNSNTGLLSGTPGIGDIGTTTGIVISVDDAQSSVSLPAFEVQVVGSGSGVASLSWAPPVQNADNTPLTDLAGYRIYYGTSAGNYPNSVTIWNSGVTTGMVENLAPGTWNFVVTAFDYFGNESGYSNVATKTVSAP